MAGEIASGPQGAQHLTRKAAASNFLGNLRGGENTPAGGSGHDRAVTVALLLIALQQTPLGPPPARLGLDPFYQKWIDLRGLPIVGSAKVSDEALRLARDTAAEMLVNRKDVAPELARRRIRVAIMAATEQTTDIPEHSDLNRVFPSTDWNARARGLGATVARPAISAAEENLLGLKGDRYRGESIFVHEFAHTVADFGLAKLDSDFTKRLESAYRDAMQRGLWKRTYAATNSSEYWAEGVQSYFDCNRTASPADGIHNEVGTREQLRSYDPALFRLIDSSLRSPAWRWKDPAKK